MVSVGVRDGEVAGGVVGLVHQWMHTLAPTESARLMTASGSAVTTCKELVPGRHGVVRSPVLESITRPPSGQSNASKSNTPAPS
jgi:hypothetical protein